MEYKRLLRDARRPWTASQRLTSRRPSGSSRGGTIRTSTNRARRPSKRFEGGQRGQRRPRRCREAKGLRQPGRRLGGLPARRHEWCRSSGRRVWRSIRRLPSGSWRRPLRVPHGIGRGGGRLQRLLPRLLQRRGDRRQAATRAGRRTTTTTMGGMDLGDILGGMGLDRPAPSAPASSRQRRRAVIAPPARHGRRRRDPRGSVRGHIAARRHRGQAARSDHPTRGQ